MSFKMQTPAEGGRGGRVDKRGERRDQQQERKGAALNSQRQRLHSRRAPTCCHGNTTYSVGVCAHAGSCVCDCGHTRCISQQLVTLLQTSGGCGKDVTLFRW